MSVKVTPIMVAAEALDLLRAAEHGDVVAIRDAMLGPSQRYGDAILALAVYQAVRLVYNRPIVEAQLLSVDLTTGKVSAEDDTCYERGCKDFLKAAAGNDTMAAKAVLMDHMKHADGCVTFLLALALFSAATVIRVSEGSLEAFVRKVESRLVEDPR